MAKPGYEEAWAQIYPTVFCIDQNDPDLKRQPGLLKVCTILILNTFFFKIVFRQNFKLPMVR